ncbi:MaoC family dehydratase N-terminal domain-containing protein [Lutimaribacter sp. EGI FJ00015]|uniref:MaoC family dehydratase N-terminal domain-containing protein n=1 Tax=Lutimaribacter degradans TaxID=2945989 RepID=A0ACC5ZW62_9RHOB|nr:MaoC family dehydratase N-terminal domain-containing protein [Lutimaribacter sp. EGI FJ00013]MCM2562598.1 MaoC family dehydratase N-terminal domain-containing protein [Lutimaribacter sp. EGI FJ00013]MCO0613755.1 MaoC family dehydratase N-terminal domain-containing protein [Lutimaribacter sp. EGI FJ00015]MCO0636762.1 MaoC family dehydratase N-terminal domain-containing protein [Lutimaribacter sp. EGI FJ00014]
MSDSQTDVMDPARARALQATLGLPTTIEDGDPLPPFFHQVYFWAPEPPARLGRDGHPKTGIGLIPDMGLPRRMWAGGRLEFHGPLRAGVMAERRSVVESTKRKEGRTGPLAFVTLRHEFRQEGVTRVTEWQDLVYREDPDPTTPAPMPPQAPTGEDAAETWIFGTTRLFRYSALTFNGHRIHYDMDYSTGVEGYAGLVTHGPLLAQLLMLLAERQLGALSTFAFRATAPLMHDEEAQVCWREDGTLWVRGPDGRQCVTAQAT